MRKAFPYCCYASVCILFAFLIIPSFLPTTSNEVLTDKFDAIIVLGAGLKGNCDLGMFLRIRMEKAIELYQQKKATKIILTGGPQWVDRFCIEAEAMRQFALAKNIPDESIITENLARNTYENAYYSAALMQQTGMRSAIIVTSDFHSKRANIIFEQYDFNYKVIAATNKTKRVQRYTAWYKEQFLLCFHTLFGVPNNFGLNLKEQNLTSVLKSLAQN